MGKQTTLADIARAAGVTSMTVQRALKGSEGVGAEQRRRIRQIADEMHYRPNTMASVLKRGDLRLAAVLPDSNGENRYYAENLWAGLDNFLKCNTVFQIQCSKWVFDWSAKNLALTMEKLLAECGDTLDGVITVGSSNPEFLNVLKKLDERQIPYIFVGSDYRDCNRLCCVSAYNEVAGQLAADLFLNFAAPAGGGRLLVTGDFSIQDQERNAVGFERELRQRTEQMEILKLSNHNRIDETSCSIEDLLRADINIAGIYSCSARNTLAACQAMEAAQCFVPTVGSDVFAETIQLMKAGKLQAIIHKRHYEQTYRAMQVLTEYLIMNQKPARSTEYVIPVIAMNGNIDCFMDNGQHRQEMFFDLGIKWH